MIKAERGNVTIKGSRHELMADYSTIVKGIMDTLVNDGESKEEVLKELEFAFEMAQKSTEEIKDEVVKILLDLLSGGKADE